ncbi:MAG: PIN domain-containing protein [Gammaproteobacteria bacterium]|nr:PIN domain-containing protein [Gammaproteobacteria bacterium]
MAKPAAFFDTNVLVYLFSGDEAKAATARELVRKGGSISVQALNEFVATGRRKLHMSWTDAATAVAGFAALCQVHPVTLETNREALELARRHGWHIYDALVVAAARQAGADVLYTEDLQSGQKIGRLQIRNPFLG